MTHEICHMMVIVILLITNSSAGKSLLFLASRVAFGLYFVQACFSKSVLGLTGLFPLSLLEFLYDMYMNLGEGNVLRRMSGGFEFIS